MKTEEFIAQLRQGAGSNGMPPWKSAGPWGAEAVPATAPLLKDGDFETARNAKRALAEIVHHAGRPGAGKEAKRVERALVGLLSNPAPEVRSEAVWLLSEIGSKSCVRPIGKLLADADVREDARCALIRLPYARAVTELESGLKQVPEDFKVAVADALRARGKAVSGYPSRKKVPTAQTEVKPMGA